MAAAESARLAAALKKEGVPLGALAVNQLLEPGVTAAFLDTRRRDQARALEMLRNEPELARLQLIEAPLFDLEVRGVAALSYFGSQVWK